MLRAFFKLMIYNNKKYYLAVKPNIGTAFAITQRATMKQQPEHFYCTAIVH
ncbi:MAG TPA: hypothetical protein VIC08_12515 [Cellvibrionaceae bacterium]